MSRSSLVLILVVVVLVNFPLAQATWTRASVERAGTRVEAPIVDEKNLGTTEEPAWWLTYTLPEELDPEQGTWSAQVEAAAYAQARRDRRITVTALPGEPETAIVEGEIRTPAALISTLVADAMLLALLALVWRSRGRGRREVVTVEALEDFSPAAPGEPWEDLADGTVRVRGEVLQADAHEVLLGLDDRLVRVVLDGRAGPVGPAVGPVAGPVDRRQHVQVRVRRAIGPDEATNPTTR